MVRTIPGLRLVAVDADLLRAAEAIVRSTGWRPRDAIHAATAIRETGGRILALDAGYAANPASAEAIGLRVELVA
jgi:predicted nucleic acid-binding protein